MRLKRMILENIGGIKRFVLNIDGKDAVVFGENGVGKTTLANAFLWLLTGKDTDFKSSSVKPLNEDGSEVHHIESSVEVEFVDGLTLKKVLIEKWTKMRGKLNKEYTGNTDKYYVNQVPTPAAKYKQKIAELIGSEDILKILINPYYFASILPWQKRREVLLQLSGDVNLKEVLASMEPDYRVLEEPLEKHGVDDYLKIINETLTKINDDKKSIPARIDEQNIMAPDVTGLDLVMLKSKRKDIEKEGKALLEKKRALQRNDALEEAKAKLKDLIIKRHERVARIKAKSQPVLNKLLDLKFKNDQLSGVDGQIRHYIDEKERLCRIEIAPPPVAEVCEYCGQDLSPELIAKRLKVEAEEHQKLVAECEATLTDLEAKRRSRREIQVDIAELQEEFDGYEEKASAPDTKIITLEKKITKLESADNLVEIAKIDAEREELKHQYRTLTADIDKFDDLRKIVARKNELLQEEERLGIQYEEWDRTKFMLEEVIRRRVELLDKRVVRALGIPGVSVKMFNDQFNGGLKQCCEMTYLGVPFPKVNRSRQIKVGLKLIDLLAKHWNIEPVVFIDNSEAVNRLPEVLYQTIELEVSNDPELTVNLRDK